MTRKQFLEETIAEQIIKLKTPHYEYAEESIAVIKAFREELKLINK